MQSFDYKLLQKLYKPDPQSHKGQNGKVMVIGGSKLFHSASLWPLQIASKIVDMVFFSSVPENNEVVLAEKKLWQNGIIVPREKIDDYITECDAILIGPGLPRKEGMELGDDNTKVFTETLLKKYPDKKWVIDGGSLQTIDPTYIPKNAILTPHHGEFETLFKVQIQNEANIAQEMAEQYNCTILLKGSTDFVCSSEECGEILGGNAGMTKGGTGDVLAGLVVALYAKNNDPFLVACAASYLNKKAGDSLFERVGPYYNASDLVREIPLVMKQLLF